MVESAIRTKDLSCNFGDIKAVEKLCLDVPKGIVFGFLGPNGSGKTTTMRLLLGLLEPQAGKAEILGFDTRQEANQIRKRCGALLEHTGLYERLSAEDNLAFYARINRMPSMMRQERIQALLQHFGLWDRRQERVGKWSRGMKQKLAIARALLHRPEMIFLDEPTAGLDPVAAAALREDIAALVADAGVTVFLNTHNLPEAEKLCGQIGVIRDGRLLTVGSLDELRRGKDGAYLEISGQGLTPAILAQLNAHPMVKSTARKNQHVVIGLAPGADTTKLVRFMLDAGVQVDEVRKSKLDLEDVFLKMMAEEPHAG